MRAISKIIVLTFLFFSFSNLLANTKLAYVVSDTSIPFWQIMSKGIEKKAKNFSYKVNIYNSKNSSKEEIKNFYKAINSDVSGIILSPTTSLSAVFLLNLAKKAKIPVVICDVGANSGDFVSFISSNNEKGAYNLGKVLAKKMKELNFQDGSVGIIGIPQKRENGKLRTKGFLKAINEEGIKSAGLRQQVDFSYKETYDFTIELINKNPNMKALWLQGSDKYQGALDAISKMNKTNKILLICFDTEPEFLQMIKNNKLVGAAMQQAFLMGEVAVVQMVDYLKTKKAKKYIQLDVLVISKENIKSKLKIIKRNVLGLEN